MKKINVLLLGWEFPPVLSGGWKEACYGISKALANQVNLSLILPKANPEFILKNVELTGLNNVEFPVKQAEEQKPSFTSPFSEAPVYNEPFPYGTSHEQINEKPEVQYEGQGVSAGTLGVEQTDRSEYIGKVEDLNIFGQPDFSAIDRNSQVIQYARYVSRLANQKSFDVIYAYDWMTFLAGVELKLVSGKPLVLQIDSVSFERGGPDCRGWIYELEKQALEKSDFIIAVSEGVSAAIKGEYGIDPSKIHTIGTDENLVEPEPEVPEEVEEFIIGPGGSQHSKLVAEPEQEPAAEIDGIDWDEVADEITKILEKVTAAPVA